MVLINRKILFNSARKEINFNKCLSSFSNKLATRVPVDGGGEQSEHNCNISYCFTISRISQGTIKTASKLINDPQECLTLTIGHE